MQVITLVQEFDPRHIHYTEFSIYQYDDYVYSIWDDVEEDNIKRFHEVTNNVTAESVHMPLSPYIRIITAELFKNWIDMGMPTRDQLGGNRIKHHEEYYQKWVQEQMEKEFDL